MSLPRRIAAEALGSLLLTAAVVGSGIMAERLAGGNLALALLANTFATVAALAVLIGLLAPVSGAHFNPVVSVALAFRGQVTWREAGLFSVVQIVSCCLGAMLAHAMFALALVQGSLQAREGVGQLLGEVVATFGLLLVVLGHRRPSDAPWMIAAWIGAAYWLTSSTSFANPAITIARSLTGTFTGIRVLDAPAFIGAQVVGMMVAVLATSWLFPRSGLSADKD